MAKSIKLSNESWKKLKSHLDRTQPKSVMLISYKMREVLGFTPRVHSEFYSTTGYNVVTYLDFWDDHLETLFRLKYSEYLNE